jgi:hypothetical protein
VHLGYQSHRWAGGDGGDTEAQQADGVLLRLIRYLVWFVTGISLAVDCDLEWSDNPAVGAMQV